jgi:hypothetical protein
VEFVLINPSPAAPIYLRTYRTYGFLLANNLKQHAGPILFFTFEATVGGLQLEPNVFAGPLCCLTLAPPKLGSKQNPCPISSQINGRGR